MREVPVFVSEAVLARVRDGSFVAARRARRKTGRDGSDRRRVFSPLSVTKRCIRYDPNVFTHRRAQILQMAEALNDPEIKMLLVAGLQGAGKTSMVRGVIELMGGHNEQLLWFDVNRHTDFEEIIHFLIQYISYIGQSLQAVPPPAPVGQREPLRELDALIRAMAEVPLLIVLDNVEYLVDSDFRFNSYPFKEMLNFLLGFPNIKMLLIGERLPYADISPNQRGVLEVQLEALSPQAVTEFLARKTEEALDAEVLARLCDKSLGMPWLLKLLYYLNHQLALHVEALDRELSGGQSLVEELCDFIVSRLTSEELRQFQTLALLRHPVNLLTLQALTRRCFPDVDPLGRADAAAPLEESLIRPVLKISFPPQQVLAEIRESLERQAGGLSLSDEENQRRRREPWYELYRQVKKHLYGQLSDLERARLHGVLQEFYLEEKNRPLHERISHIKSRALLTEAKHHSLAARKRRESGGAVLGNPGSPGLASEPLLGDSVETRSYLDSRTPPLSAGKTYTLADYRTWQLDESAASAEPGVNLEGVALTEEERQLLYGDAGGPVSQSIEGPAEPLSSGASERETAAELAGLYVDTTAPAATGQPVDESEKPLLEVLSAAVASRNKPAFAQALLALGEHRLRRGDTHRAEECLLKAEGLKESLPPAGQAELYRLQGSLYQQTFRHNEAETVLLRAAQALLLQEEPDTPEVKASLGEIYLSLGEIAAYRGQYPRALESLERALVAFEGQPVRQAEVLFAMAGVYDESSQPTQALAMYRQALALEQDDDLACAATWANMGSILLELERVSEAEAAFEASLAHDRKAGHTRGQGKTLESLARLHWEQGDLQRAEREYLQALALAVQEGQRLWQANLYLKLGDLAAERSDWTQARLQYGRALSSAGDELSDASRDLIEAKRREVDRATERNE